MRMPHFVMTGLYLLLAAVVTLDSALAGLGWAPAFAGLRWMRVHFITLGVLTELLFGLLPALTAKGLNLPRPKMNWTSWLLYNSGLVILLIGLPIIDQAMIISGGTLIFIAVLALIKDLVGLRRAAIKQHGHGVCSTYPTTRFYLAGLAYLLVGVLVGTGMWIGWSGPLGIATPKEVHVHTNLWGYTALIFAGLIFDLFPSLAGQRVFGKGPRRVRLDRFVFGTLALGALGLVVGPWAGWDWPAVIGLILHTLGTLVLLGHLVWLLARNRVLRRPGAAHLISSYLWLLIPVVAGPFIVINAANFPVGEVAGNGGPILIYGWVLTFCLAIIPYALTQAFTQTLTPNRQPDDEAHLGGTWWGLASVHIGGALFWLTLFLPDAQAILRPLAFLFWLAALLPPLKDLYALIRAGAERMDGEAAVPPLPATVSGSTGSQG